MNKMRREFMAKAMGTVSAFGVFFALPSQAKACLRGTWKVRCPDGHDDIVEGVTCNHDCEGCGKKAVSGGNARVVCPKGHASPVSGITESHRCPEDNCGLQCRRD
jgi:hypothetical protein